MKFSATQFLSDRKLSLPPMTQERPTKTQEGVPVEEERKKLNLISAASKNNPNLSEREALVVAAALEVFVNNSFRDLKLPSNVQIDSVIPLPRDSHSRWALSSARDLEFIAFEPLNKTSVFRLNTRFNEDVYLTISSKGELLEIGIPSGKEESKVEMEGYYKNRSIIGRKADELLAGIREAIGKYARENKLQDVETNRYLEVANKGVLEHVAQISQAGGDLNKLSITRTDIYPDLVGVSYKYQNDRLVTGYPVGKSTLTVEPLSPKETEKDKACNKSIRSNVRFFEERVYFREDRLSPYSQEFYGEIKRSFVRQLGEKGFSIGVSPESAMPGKSLLELRLSSSGGDRIEVETLRMFVDKEILESTVQSYTNMSDNQLTTNFEQLRYQGREDEIIEILEMNANAYLKKAVELRLITQNEAELIKMLDTRNKVNKIIDANLAITVRKDDLERQRFQIINRVRGSKNPSRDAFLEISKLVEAATDAGLIDTCEEAQLVKQAREGIASSKWEAILNDYLDRFSSPLYNAQIFSKEVGENAEGRFKVPRDLNSDKIKERLRTISR